MRLPSLRRGLTILAALALLSGCSADGSSELGRGTGQNGYVERPGNLTQIPIDQRQPVPVIAGPELGSDRTLSTAAYAGKVVVINVWGSWCGPCRKEAPELQAASVETADIAQFIGVTSKDNDPAPAEAFIRANQITYPSIFDPSGAVLLNFAGLLPPSNIPSTMIIDREGRLAVRVLGPVSKITLVDMIGDVAAGR